MGTVNDRIRKFFESMTDDVVEDRVVEYVVREVHNGRRLMEVIDDPYVRNRLNDVKRDNMLQNTEIVDALESEIHQAFKPEDIGFSS